MLSAWWFSGRDFVPVYVENAPKDSKYGCHKNKVSDVQHKLPLITVATSKHKKNVCLLHSIWFPKLKLCGTWKNEWTYLCPDSWAMVKARPSPVSSLIVQLRYLLHIPLIGAKPAERKKQQNMGGRIYLYEWLMHLGNMNQNWLFTEEVWLKTLIHDLNSGAKLTFGLITHCYSTLSTVLWDLFSW